MLVATATLLASGLVAGTAHGQDVPPSAIAPTLSLIDQPLVVEPDGTFGVLVAVDDAPAATDLAIDIFDRAEPGEVVGVEPTEDPQATFDLVALPEADGGARRTSGFAIELFAPGQDNPDPAWGYEIDEPGVYPVRVRLWDADGNVLAVMMTAIVRLPEADQEVAPTQVALLADGRRSPPEDRAARVAGQQDDTSLLDQVTPVLDALEARPTLPATWALTPDAIARLAADEAATDDLGRLRSALAGDDRTLLDSSYVDLDPASLVDAGLDDELSSQRDLGRGTLTELLEEPLAGTWLLSHRVDETTLEALRTRGIFRTVLPGDALGDGRGVVEPVDVAAGDGRVRAAATSELYVAGAASDDPVLAAHRLLARLAAVSTDRTDAAQVIVDLDPERADPTTLSIVLDALVVSTPYYAPTSLDDALEAAATDVADPAAPELPSLGRFPSELRRARTDLASYTSMVGARPELTGGFDRTLAVSAADALPLEERRADATSVSDDLTVPFSAISVPPTDTVTLGAQDATFPLPIESSLDEPVQVVIELEASDRIEFPNDRIEATLDDERNVVQVRVRTRASGDTPVRVTVRTPDDGVILAQSRYVIRSTAVSGVGIFLTVGAAGFLVLWWGRHWRRARRAKRAAADPAEAAV
jgi:hypothetical protein